MSNHAPIESADEQQRRAGEKWNSGAMDGGPVTTPTAALVEEAQSMTTDTLIEEAMGEMHRLGIDNLRAKGAIVLLVEALRRAEAERDESRRDAEAYKRQTQEVSAKAIELTKEVSAKLEQAEAECDAQHAEVLRLTAERDAAKARLDRILDPPIKRMNMADGEINVVFDAPEMARIIATTFWDCLDEHNAKNYVEMSFASPESPTKRVVVTVRKLIGRTPEELREAVAKERDLLLTENAQLQHRLSRPDPVVHETPVDGVVPCCGQKLHDLKDGSRVNEGPLVNCDRMRLLSRVGELSSENLLRNEENARLQRERDDALARAARDDAGVTVHACPAPGFGLMPCCGRPPFEVMQDRITCRPELVNCDRVKVMRELAEARAHIATLELLRRGGK